MIIFYAKTKGSIFNLLKIFKTAITLVYFVQTQFFFFKYTKEMGANRNNIVRMNLQE